MAMSFVSVPTSHQTLLSQHDLYTKRNSFLHPSTALTRYPSKPVFISLCSSSSSSSLVEEEEGFPPSPPPSLQSESASDDAGQLPVRGCKACGREAIEKGCNGEGRIQGGIATVPGFGWWPIKAYRPCPGFVASGGRYRRRGQSMDEVAFGRGEKKTPVRTAAEDEPRKKRKDPRKLKR